MTCYGIERCGQCYGYGIVLTDTELLEIAKAYTTGWLQLPEIERSSRSIPIERCDRCKGLGFKFTPNISNEFLTALQTVKRWDK